jgi:hypothetical protein
MVSQTKASRAAQLALKCDYLISYLAQLDAPVLCPSVVRGVGRDRFCLAGSFGNKPLSIDPVVRGQQKRRSFGRRNRAL